MKFALSIQELIKSDIYLYAVLETIYNLWHMGEIHDLGKETFAPYSDDQKEAMLDLLDMNKEDFTKQYRSKCEELLNLSEMSTDKEINDAISIDLTDDDSDLL